VTRQSRDQLIGAAVACLGRAQGRLRVRERVLRPDHGRGGLSPLSRFRLRVAGLLLRLAERA
jgi:hypothetical protein